MKIAFLTEMGFEGKINSNHSNMRTEFAWMYALNADHRHINYYKEVKVTKGVFKDILHTNLCTCLVFSQFDYNTYMQKNPIIF